MKISIIGAGNVGATAAMRIVQDNLGDCSLIDIAKGIAKGKALDLDDARQALKCNYKIKGSEDIADVKDSDIVVMTAGLARKPGMTREELLAKNAQIVKDVCLNIKKLAPKTILVVVTNPLDLMTYLALKVTGFDKNKVFGMGVSLDASRFANLIAQELDVLPSDIDAVVLGSHGEGMLPLAKHTHVKGRSLDKLLDDSKIEALVNKTIGRGAEIVANLGSGSAFFAPSACVQQIVKSIAKDEKKIIGACAYLSGEYGVKDICMGVPCLIGRNGIEKIIQLDLSEGEKRSLLNCADSINNLLKQLP